MAEGNDLALGYAMGQDSNGNGGFGGGWGEGIWAVIILGMIFGWGNGGWGGNAGGYGGGFNAPGAQGWATRADINEGFALNGLQNGQTSIKDAVTNGFHGVDNAVRNLGYQLQDCCCQTQRAIDGVNYNMATQSCDIRNTIQNATRDIIENANGNTRAILDFLTQDKISSLQAENQALKFAASQQSQNAFITANQEAQTAELIRRLGRDCPVPAYVVPNPNCCYGNPVGVGYPTGNNACTCGC